MIVDYAINVFGSKTDRQSGRLRHCEGPKSLILGVEGARMELKELQRNWDILGKEDPLWAIITWQDKKGNKWDPAEFFASGRQEIGDVMQTSLACTSMVLVSGRWTSVVESGGSPGPWQPTLRRRPESILPHR